MEINTPTKNEKPWWRDSVILFVQLSSWIAVPVILALFIGKWLDKKYNTDPWLFLATVIAAFIISTFGIVKEAISAMKKIDNLGKSQNDDKSKKYSGDSK